MSERHFLHIPLVIASYVRIAAHFEVIHSIVASPFQSLRQKRSSLCINERCLQASVWARDAFLDRAEHAIPKLRYGKRASLIYKKIN